MLGNLGFNTSEEALRQVFANVNVLHGIGLSKELSECGLTSARAESWFAGPGKPEFGNSHGD